MLIGAGAETTSGTIQWFFEIMALHPELVQKAQEGKYSGLDAPCWLGT